MPGKKRMGAPIRTPQGDNPVAAFRKRLGISQAEAAEMLGIERGTVGKYERGALKIPKAIQLLVAMLEEHNSAR